jgi:hypothetical protein
MALKLTYDNPSYPKDEEIEVHGLGLVKNGRSVELTEDQEKSFVSVYGESVRDATKDDENVKVEGTALLGAKEVTSLTAPEVNGGEK